MMTDHMSDEVEKWAELAWRCFMWKMNRWKQYSRKDQRNQPRAKSRGNTYLWTGTENPHTRRAAISERACGNCIVMGRSVIAGCFYVALWPGVLGECVFTGAVCGYVVYDMVHYYLHYGSPRPGSYLYAMKALHVKHHFEHQRAGFGVTSPLWDYPFNTAIPEEKF
ncbi:hypothetical protein CRUP_010094 [Coryphaenoides rupestris]|nr:hypothetical protein CRUP_010094 [Coryphaenoides rupestris]